jgi:hypothetical protein
MIFTPIDPIVDLAKEFARDPSNKDAKIALANELSGEGKDSVEREALKVLLERLESVEDAARKFARTAMKRAAGGSADSAGDMLSMLENYNTLCGTIGFEEPAVSQSVA